MSAPIDWGAKAHAAAAEHLEACQQAQWCEEGECEIEGHEVDVPGRHSEARETCPSPAIGPFCGCETCVIREVLHAAWPVIEEGVRSGDFG